MVNTTPLILIIDRSPQRLTRFETLLAQKCGARTLRATNAQGALTQIIGNPFLDCVIVGDVECDVSLKSVCAHIKSQLWNRAENMLVPAIVNATGKQGLPTESICTIQYDALIQRLEKVGKETSFWKIIADSSPKHKPNPKRPVRLFAKAFSALFHHL